MCYLPISLWNYNLIHNLHLQLLHTCYVNALRVTVTSHPTYAACIQSNSQSIVSFALTLCLNEVYIWLECLLSKQGYMYVLHTACFCNSLHSYKHWCIPMESFILHHAQCAVRVQQTHGSHNSTIVLHHAPNLCKYHYCCANTHGGWELYVSHQWS